jgi:hypothetical protein
MTPPTLEQLRAYAAEISYTDFDPTAFLDHYEMVGWVCGRHRTPMRNWQAAVRTWRRLSGQWSPKPKVETDPAILDYAQIGKAKIAAGGYEIGRWYQKVRDAIGPDGLERVKNLIRGGETG